MYCSNCGKELDDKTRYCPWCGAPTVHAPLTGTVDEKAANDKDDVGSVWWTILSVFMPVVGVILYVCWRNSKPKDAKAAIRGVKIYLVIALVWVSFILLMALLLSY